MAFSYAGMNKFLSSVSFIVPFQYMWLGITFTWICQWRASGKSELWKYSARFRLMGNWFSDGVDNPFIYENNVEKFTHIGSYATTFSLNLLEAPIPHDFCSCRYHDLWNGSEIYGNSLFSFSPAEKLVRYKPLHLGFIHSPKPNSDVSGGSQVFHTHTNKTCFLMAEDGVFYNSQCLFQIPKGLDLSFHVR